MQATLSFEQSRSEFNLVIGIHVQDGNGSATNWCFAHNECTSKLKVILPDVPARIKQWDDAGGLWISSRDVGGLRKIAVNARHSKILDVVGSAVFSRIKATGRKSFTGSK